MSWLDMGVPEWLADRADRMGFSVPTQVQRDRFPPKAKRRPEALMAEPSYEDTEPCVNV